MIKRKKFDKKNSNKYWTDPVWSKVISAVILLVSGSVLTAIKSNNKVSLIKIFLHSSTEINNLILIVCLVIFLILIVLLIRKQPAILASVTAENNIKSDSYYPIVLNESNIQRRYALNHEDKGLSCVEIQYVDAQIKNSEVNSLVHSISRIENNYLKYKLLDDDYKLDFLFPESVKQLVDFKCTQKSSTRLGFRLNFPIQKPNTIFKYRITTSYTGAQFKDQKEINDAIQNYGLNRNYCISGRRIIRPTKRQSIKLIFPANYKVIPDVYVSNKDGEMSTLANELRPSLITEVDLNNQIVVTLLIEEPIIGLMYAIKWNPPTQF